MATRLLFASNLLSGLDKGHFYMELCYLRSCLKRTDWSCYTHVRITSRIRKRFNVRSVPQTSSSLRINMTDVTIQEKT